MTYKPQCTRAMLRSLVERCLACSTLDEVCDVLERYAKQRTRAWRKAFKKLERGLRQIADPARKKSRRQRTLTPFRVFVTGNSKLPFAGFSALPDYTCPGAGECLRFCYSFTAWRYPAAFARQLQNTLLLKHAPHVIRDEFLRLREGCVLRLYVDGDIDSTQTLAFWFRCLRLRPDVLAYGYSKSLEIIDEWRAQNLPWVENYRLNLSSGSRYEDNAELLERMMTLQLTRGRFVVVKTRGHYARGFERFESADYHAEVRALAREQYGTQRVFSCPGKCGECLPSGEHACGSERFNGVLIAIGEH